MSSSFAALLPALAAVAAKTTGVVVAAVVVTALMKTRSAAARHAVWTAALGAALLLPLARATLPPLPIALLAAPAEGVIPRAATTGISGHAGVAADAGTFVVPGAPGDTADTKRTWVDVIACTWLAGVLALALYMGAGTLRLRRFVRRAPLAGDARLVARVEFLRQSLSVRRSVTVRIAPREWTPMALGVLRPAILLPASVPTWGRERLDSVILHELAHVARLDAVSHLIARLAVAIFWFNPLIWLAARQARLERERACDDVVLTHGISAPRYAADLLALVASLTLPSTLNGETAVAGRAPLQRRIAAILEGNLSRNRLTRSGAVVVGGIMLSVTPLLASARLVPKGSALPPIAAPPPAAVAPATPFILASSLAVASEPDPTLSLSSATPADSPPVSGPAQTKRPPVDLSGTWIPDDSERVQALFEVGLSRYPGSGVIVSQDSRRLTISMSFEMGRERALVQRILVYALDGTESVNPSPLWPIDREEVSRAGWDGDRLVVTLRSGNRERHESYSMADGVLKIETDERTLTFRRKT